MGSNVTGTPPLVKYSGATYWQHIGCLETRNFVKRVSVDYIATKPPLVDEHAFQPTGFAVAWLSCTLQVRYMERVVVTDRVMDSEQS